MKSVGTDQHLWVRAARWATLAGLAAYAAGVMWGGFRYPGYSHMSHAISDLTGSASPVRAEVEPFFTIYNLALAFFTLLLWHRVGASTSGRVMVAALAVIAVAGLVMAAFPSDPVGSPLTRRGFGHLALAGIQSLSTIVALGAGARASRAGAVMKPISMAGAILLLILGAATAAAAGMQWTYFGIIERLTIGTFLLWWALLAFLLRDFSEHSVPVASDEIR